jgi:hypothetical protein
MQLPLQAPRENDLQPYKTQSTDREHATKHSVGICLFFVLLGEGLIQPPRSLEPQICFSPSMRRGYCPQNARPCWDFRLENLGRALQHSLLRR